MCDLIQIPSPYKKKCDTWHEDFNIEKIESIRSWEEYSNGNRVINNTYRFSVSDLLFENSKDLIFMLLPLIDKVDLIRKIVRDLDRGKIMKMLESGKTYHSKIKHFIFTELKEGYTIVLQDRHPWEYVKNHFDDTHKFRRRLAFAIIPKTAKLNED